jgi:hypothetical protein
VEQPAFEEGLLYGVWLVGWFGLVWLLWLVYLVYEHRWFQTEHQKIVF